MINERMIRGLLKLGAHQLKSRQYRVETKDFVLDFYESKEGRVIFNLECQDQNLRRKVLAQVLRLADKCNVTLRVMCAPKGGHLQQETLYPKLKSAQIEYTKLGFTKDKNSWSFMTRIPNAPAITDSYIEESSASFNLPSNIKDVKVGAKSIGAVLGENPEHAEYCTFVIPHLIDSWFHGRLMHKKMRDVDLQLENEIIEAFLFVRHHFIIPDKYPKFIYRITKLKGVDYNTVKKVRTALRPIQSWTKTEKAAKKFFIDFFENMNKDTSDVARVEVAKPAYTPYALIDRDQLEIYIRALIKFYENNKSNSELATWVSSNAPKDLAYLKLSNKDPIGSYLKSVTKCVSFTLSPYIKKQDEIVLDIPRETLIKVSEVIPAEEL